MQEQKAALSREPGLCSLLYHGKHVRDEAQNDQQGNHRT
jgi:hypothetical protein